MSAGQTSEISPDPLTIEQAGNGYILYRSLEQLGLRGSDHLRKPHVFPSKAALFAHLAEHFTHECDSVTMDEKPKGIVVSKAIADEMERAGAIGAITGAGFTDFNRRPA